jgi:hypothetical protein
MELLYMMGAVFGLAIGWFAHEQYLRWRTGKKLLRLRLRASPTDMEHHYHADLSATGKSDKEAARLFDKVTQQLHDEQQ